MGILEKGILCILAAFLLYIEAVLLWLMSLDWHRSKVQKWLRYLESLSLFWIAACFAAAWTQLLAVGIAACVWQFRKQPVSRNPLPQKTWKRLFFGGAVMLVLLIGATCRIGSLYTAAYAAQEDSAAGYAWIFFPLVIAAELAAGCLLWLLWDRLGKRGTGLTGKGKRMLRSRGQGERPWN